MQNYDYVILFDENGQPYIEHSMHYTPWLNTKSWGKKSSGRVKGTGKTAHKYLMKVGEGVKARYAYTKAEVDALMGRGRKAAKKTVDKVNTGAKNTGQKVRDRIGITALNKANDLNDNYNNEVRGYNRAKNRLADAKNYEAESRAAYDSTLSNANSYTKKHPIMTTKKATELHNEVNAAKDDWIKKNRMLGSAQLNEAMRDAAVDKADNDLTTYLLNDYAKTPLGKITIAAAKADIAVDVAKKYLSAKANDIEDYLSDAGDKAKDYVSEKLNNAKDFASDKINDLKEAYENRRTKNTKVESANATRKEKPTIGTGDKESDAKKDAASSNSPKIDPKKVSTEYVYALGSNTGHASNVNKVMQAETAYNRAMREYNQVSASKNASGQDKNAAKREMDKLKKEYEKLYNDLIDELNEE